MKNLCLSILVVVFFSGCATSVTETDRVTLAERCTNAGISNAFYVGPYKKQDDTLEVEDFYRDIYCADAFIKKYPDKFLTIFGSSSRAMGSGLTFYIRGISVNYKA